MMSVDGVWFSWTPWSECSLTCGNGTKNRSRECNGPYHGGKSCKGPKEDLVPCFLKMCPGTFKNICSLLVVYFFLLYSSVFRLKM
ncbi:hypothetical protein KUTeg_016965 [Tegillarca granosa]|uniref:Uncharacterized protein n=1 Tax=Tegillarca granosa TaxID=220873 RepID=A0ABQ9ESP3_TEGGR|nr:hypothetical protein KUTeg_016965 [Tegillarca granosa]